MSWATSNIWNRHVDATGANGNTVVANTDVRGSDVDVSRVTDVDAISVLAVRRSCNIEPVKMNIVTPMKSDMEALAVH